MLPPTNNVTQPSPKLAETPFYVNTEARPWIQLEGAGRGRAGVSAFGFGGTNFHIVLEEYVPDETVAKGRVAYRLNRVAQPVVLWAATPGALGRALRAPP